MVASARTREVVREFHAMNTLVRCVVVTGARQRGAAERALEKVEALFADIEHTLSRFLPDSDLTRLNASAGTPFQASPLLFSVVEQALIAAESTAGLFDPTILGALVRAGYDRSYERLREGGGEGPVASRPDALTHSLWRDIRLESATRTIILPAGSGIDLGGIGKGWTVDQTSLRLQSFAGFVVDAGGDMAACGLQENGQPWSVGVEDPHHPGHDLATLALRNGAIATSSTARRRWTKAGEPQHHLIDPRTGLPSTTGVTSATVVAGSVARAEVLTKAMLLLGPEDGLRFLNAQADAAGLMVLDAGDVRFSANLDPGRYAN